MTGSTLLLWILQGEQYWTHHTSSNYKWRLSVADLLGIINKICPITGLVSVSSIRLTRTLLPSHAILGEDVVLECGYDMEGDRLYSVKWYRNGKEFYRHIPSDSPPTAVFSQPGLVVDVSQSWESPLVSTSTLQEVHSTETRIVLKRVQLSSEGSYLCEVSGEAPLFQTAKNENYLSVVGNVTRHTAKPQRVTSLL